MVPLFQKAVEVLIEHPQTVFFVSGFPRNDQENPDPSGDVFFPARI